MEKYKQDLTQEVFTMITLVKPLGRAYSPATYEVWPHERPKVSVVIPALNESKNLPYVLPRIPSWVDEILLVDCHSTDATVEVARHTRPGIRIVQQTGKGKGAALQTGFKESTGDIIIMLDADGSTDPAEIPEFCALLANADFVKGSRFMQGGGTTDMGFVRRVGNSGLRILVHLLFGGSFSDLCYGYIGFWRSALPKLHVDVDGFEVETLMSIRALRGNLKIDEVPSFEYRRLNGSSNLRAVRDGWRVLRTILKEWIHSPLAHSSNHEPVTIDEVERRARNRYDPDQVDEWSKRPEITEIASRKPDDRENRLQSS